MSRSTDIFDSRRAWEKLECLVRFRFAENIDEIERLADQAGCDVSWIFVYDQIIEGEKKDYGVVTSIRSG